jgi:serine O-acetyltransferase
LQGESSTSLQVSIHPSARIGTSVFLDHATGIVVGAFVDIGDEVTIMQNVTVGRKEALVGRAPRIGRRVLLSSGATILGDINVGDSAKIGAGAVVMTDVPAGCTAVGVPAHLTNCPEEGVAGLDLFMDLPRDWGADCPGRGAIIDFSDSPCGFQPGRLFHR